MITVKNACLISISFVLGISVCFGGEADIENKIKDLKSPSKQVMLAAIGQLALSKNIEAENALIAKLKNEKDNHIRIKIVEALTVIKSSTALSEIIALTNDSNKYVRQAAIVNLGYFDRDDKTVPALKQILNGSEDDSIKMTAVNTLALYKSSAAAEAIDSISADKKADKKMRAMAVHSLGRMNTKESGKLIGKYKNDTDPEIKKLAGEAEKNKKK